jgi:predicted phosphoadenosine phosphosulfate sulfurtransferase
MRKIVKRYIKKWEQVYSNGIPDEAPHRLDELNKVPSYKRIAIAILNNDIEKIGVRQKSYWYGELKRIELSANGKIKQSQLKLF